VKFEEINLKFKNLKKVEDVIKFEPVEKSSRSAHISAVMRRRPVFSIKNFELHTCTIHINKVPQCVFQW